MQAGLNAVCPSPSSSVVMMSNSTSFMAPSSSYMAPSSSYMSSSATSIIMVPSITTAGHGDHMDHMTSTASTASPTPSTDHCHEAIHEFNHHAECTTALSKNDTATLCQGTCRVLMNSIASHCGSDVSAYAIRMLKLHCYSLLWLAKEALEQIINYLCCYIQLII